VKLLCRRFVQRAQKLSEHARVQPRSRLSKAIPPPPGKKEMEKIKDTALSSFFLNVVTGLAALRRSLRKYFGFFFFCHSSEKETVACGFGGRARPAGGTRCAQGPGCDEAFPAFTC
jgi:hypothetical protein